MCFLLSQLNRVLNVCFREQCHDQVLAGVVGGSGCRSVPVAPLQSPTPPPLLHRQHFPFTSFTLTCTAVATQRSAPHTSTQRTGPCAAAINQSHPPPPVPVPLQPPSAERPLLRLGRSSSLLRPPLLQDARHIALVPFTVRGADPCRTRSHTEVNRVMWILRGREEGGGRKEEERGGYKHANKQEEATSEKSVSRIEPSRAEPGPNLRRMFPESACKIFAV